GTIGVGPIPDETILSLTVCARAGAGMPENNRAKPRAKKTSARSFTLLSFSRAAGFENGLCDRAIGAAAADGACEPFGDLLARRMGIFHEQTLRRHNLPRRAVAALRADVADERLLKRIELLAVRDALNRQNAFSVGLEGQIVARADRSV